MSEKRVCDFCGADVQASKVSFVLRARTASFESELGGRKVVLRVAVLSKSHVKDACHECVKRALAAATPKPAAGFGVGEEAIQDDLAAEGVPARLAQCRPARLGEHTKRGSPNVVPNEPPPSSQGKR